MVHISSGSDSCPGLTSCGNLEECATSGPLPFLGVSLPENNDRSLGKWRVKKRTSDKRHTVNGWTVRWKNFDFSLPSSFKSLNMLVSLAFICYPRNVPIWDHSWEFGQFSFIFWIWVKKYLLSISIRLSMRIRRWIKHVLCSQKARMSKGKTGESHQNHLGRCKVQCQDSLPGFPI